MKFYTKYKVRIVYKSGYFHDYWVWKFDVVRDSASVKSIAWQCVDIERPLAICVDNIESVWQIEQKKVFKFFNPLV